jgi:hypothetical protein
VRHSLIFKDQITKKIIMHLLIICQLGLNSLRCSVCRAGQKIFNFNINKRQPTVNHMAQILFKNTLVPQMDLIV